MVTFSTSGSRICLIGMAFVNSLFGLSYIVLLPVFFTVTGLQTDLFTLDRPELLLWLLLILLIAIGGKLAGCGSSARGRRGSQRTRSSKPPTRASSS